MVEKILEEKQINKDFLKEYNRAVVISEKVDKKEEEAEAIKIPEHVKKFKEEIRSSKRRDYLYNSPKPRCFSTGIKTH